MTASTRVALAILVCPLLLAARDAVAADARLRAIVIDQRLEDMPLSESPTRTVPTVVRIGLPETAVSLSDDTLSRLQRTIDLDRSRHVDVIVAFEALPSIDADVEPWRQFIAAVAQRMRGKVLAYQIGRVPPGSIPNVDWYVYLLKLAAIQIRAADADAIVLQGTVPTSATDWQAQIFAAGAGPYFDGVALEGSAVESDAAFWNTVQKTAALVARENPAAAVLVGPLPLPADRASATSEMIDQVLRHLGSNVVPVFSGASAAVESALIGASWLTRLVGDDLNVLDERASDLHLLQQADDVTSTVPHRLVLDVATFETFLIYWETRGELTLEIALANATTPMMRDPINGASSPPAGVQTNPRSNRVRMTLPGAARAQIVDLTFGTSERYSTGVDVRGERLPRVEEIIARHQQAQAAQDAVVRNYIAHVRIEQHFHPSAADPAYNVITENRLFSARDGVEWEELSFELNGAKWTANRPAFPLVQPEKVLSLPLDLRLDQDYVYRLVGTGFVNDRPTFVVHFEPLDSARALYRGTVWIDRATFLRVKVQAVETKLSGPIVSNDETDFFEPAGAVDGRPVSLLTHVISKQVFLIAGRSVLIEREVRLSDIALNVVDFDETRLAARASDRIMYRDTVAGVRYLVKQGEQRVVSDHLTTSARAFVLGADIDPSFDRPLPIGGLNILDFNFLNRNMQLALIYGGVIALGNIQRASLWGGRFDVSVDFFGLALKSNDDVFDATGKRAGERVNRIPVSTGANLGYQFTPFQKVVGHYELRYDAYFRDATTATAFTVPSGTMTNGEGLGYEYRRRGYSGLANVTHYGRSRWTPWGDAATFDTRQKTYAKYDVGLSKDFTFATFQTIHLNATYFGGQWLDRFSMYQFGLFDPARMHGVPSAVRFAELGMIRASYSLNVFEQYRLDLFLDHASGRSSTTSSQRWQQVTGTGIRVNFRAPRNTILQVDVGKSLLPESYRGAGSTVLEIMLLKPL